MNLIEFRNKIQKAKDVSIESYLTLNGYDRVLKRGSNLYYYSPFRHENKPSFCVNKSKNRFKDFGGDRAGDSIDLVMAIENCSMGRAINILLTGKEEKKLLNRVYIPEEKEKLIIKKTRAIVNKKIISYICNRRSLDIDLVRKYCFEVDFSFPGSRNPAKEYCGVGMKNKKGGWEIRNNWFKGGNSPKYYTEIGNGDDVIVFEGFLNFLSWLQYNGYDEVDCSIIILNSIENRMYVQWRKYSSGFLFLDNDDGGDKATKYIMSENNALTDERSLYYGYNDMNDMIMEESRSKIRKIMRIVFNL
jgi:hypothetical protein